MVDARIAAQKSNEAGVPIDLRKAYELQTILNTKVISHSLAVKMFGVDVVAAFAKYQLHKMSPQQVEHWYVEYKTLWELGDPDVGDIRRGNLGPGQWGYLNAGQSGLYEIWQGRGDSEFFQMQYGKLFYDDVVANCTKSREDLTKEFGPILTHIFFDEKEKIWCSGVV
jgi:hypothetical protein